MEKFRWSDIPPENHVDFSLMRADFETIFRDYASKIESEWPAALRDLVGLRVYIHVVLRIVHADFGAIQKIASDDPRGPAPLAFAVAIAPLTRTILESSLNVAFMLDEPRANWSTMQRAWWRTEHEHLERQLKTYRDDPFHADWMARKQAANDSLAEEAGLTPRERAEFRTLVRRQPKPSGMLRAIKSETKKERLQYILDWFYTELSEEAHLTFTGAAIRGYALLEGDEGHDALRKLRSDNFGHTLVMILALFSEISLGLALKDRTKVVEVWTNVARAWLPARELYERHYAEALGA